MNFSKVMSLISENNINPEEVLRLVDKVRRLDMKNENNVRTIIRDVSRIAKKPISREKEDMLVKKILSEGINESLLNYI